MKRNLTSSIVIALIAVLFLTGCPFIGSLEKDVQVVINDGKTVKAYTVNQFNNAVVSAPEAPEGKVFYGWTTLKDWEGKDVESLPTTKSKGLVRYDEVKDYVVGESRSVEIYPIFIDAPRKDLVVGWYAKSGTSGIDQAAMDAFEAKLKDFLLASGYDMKTFDYGIKGYEGGVADSLALVKEDKNVDILVGWAASSNLTGTGGWVEGVDFLENVGNITIGTKARYAARLNERDITYKVYAWIQSEFGAAEAAPAPAPAPAPAVAPAPAAETKTEAPAAAPVEAPASSDTLVIGWYAKTATSGLDEAIMAKVEKGVKAFLSASGINKSVVVKAYDGVVADVEAAVVSDANVDIMVGMKAFAPAGYEMEVIQDLTMGEKTGRRIHLLGRSEEAKAVFAWFGTEAAQARLLPGEETVELVLGWYAKTGTSGLDEEIMAEVEAAVKAFLAESAIKADVVVKAYDGVVAAVEAAVVSDANVDIMVGMKAFAPAGYEMEVIQDLAMGEKTGRRIHLLGKGEEAKAVFAWFGTE
ncbi:MAG: hypothetical protein KBS81_05605, partial [Spirochaetales bacterium]|nr:hypothetical protein [Candidatus Physcosoma equi]